MSENTAGAAGRVAEADWKGPVYSEGLGFNEGFFATTRALREECYDVGIPVPAVVYGCTEHGLRFHARSIIDSFAQDDEHCEAVCEEAMSAAPDLQAVLDAWCSRLCCRTWEIANVAVLMAEQPGNNPPADARGTGGRKEA